MFFAVQLPREVLVLLFPTRGRVRPTLFSILLFSTSSTRSLRKMTSKIIHSAFYLYHHGESTTIIGDCRQCCQAISSCYYPLWASNVAPSSCWAHRPRCCRRIELTRKQTLVKNYCSHHDASGHGVLPWCKAHPHSHCGHNAIGRLLRLLWMTLAAAAGIIQPLPKKAPPWHHQQQSSLNCQHNTSSHGHEAHPRRAPPWPLP